MGQTVHRGSLDHTEITGSDVLCTSFPGVVLSSVAIAKLWLAKKKLESSPCVHDWFSFNHC